MEEVVVREPNYNRCKLITYRVGGHGFAILLMGGTAVAIFFPGATVLLLDNVDPVGVVILSLVNMLAKFNLGYYGLMFPVIEKFSKWSADQNEGPLTRRDVVEKGSVILASVPLVMVFSLGTEFALRGFYAQVVNQTTNNATQLAPLFFQVANATQIPAVNGILVGSTAGFNLIGNIWVILGSRDLVLLWKAEYEKILFNENLTDEEKELALRRYLIGMWGGLSLFLTAGPVGNVVFFPFTALMYNYFWNVPLSAGYVLGAEMFTNMMLLAFLCLVSLGKGLTEGMIDIKRGDFKWPSKPQVGVNIFKALLAEAICGSGALFSVYLAKAANLDLFLQIASGVLGSLLELGMMYKLLGVFESGIKYLLCCCSEAEKVVEVKKQDEKDSASSELEDVRVGVEREFDESSRSVTPTPEDPKVILDNKKSVTWGKWFGSFFPCCCDGSRGKRDSSGLRARHQNSREELLSVSPEGVRPQ